MQQDTTQDRILEEALRFADTEIRPFATSFESPEGIPRELIVRMAAKGYLAAPFPESYGGLGLDPLYYGLFTEAIGKASDAVRTVLTVHTSLVGETLIRCGTKEQKGRILPAMSSGEILAAFALTEPETGTDAQGIRMSYTPFAGEYYILNGRKKWITMGGMADLLLVIAANDSKTTAFLVDRKSPGITVSPMRGLLAGEASHIAEIDFQDVPVPVANRLGIEGSGFAYITNAALDYGRYSVAWGGVAIAGEALDAMVSYSRQRQQFGKSISSFQLIRALIGDAVTRQHASRALCLQAGQRRRDRHKDAIIETIIAKYHAAKAANQTAADALQVHGGNGFSDKFPVGRLFREAKVLEVIEGTSQILQQLIAEHAIHG
jgi:alkylation response protein AidB-like acyl-CoA dehydrogenase